MTVSLFIDITCKTGESPVYDAKTKRFYFVDIPNQLLFHMILLQKHLNHIRCQALLHRLP